VGNKMTTPIHSKQKVANCKIWATAMEWTSTNRKLIRQIASPYLRFMQADSNDLFQEATIAAFKALIVARKKENPEQFVPYFRVIFKTNCIKLASGIQTVSSLEEYHLPCPDEQMESEEQEAKKVEEAMRTVSKRQREICLWLLRQTDPVSTPDLAREFKVSRRHACRLISSSIEKIYGAAL